jgi:cyclohexadienyl dehydratase
MRCGFISLVLTCALQALPAFAQAPSASRLDEIMKSGKLRVCTPGDYKPFSLQRPDGGFEGLDIDLVQSAAKALGAEVVMVKTAWPSLMKDFLEKCDVAVGGISVSTDRQKSAFFTAACALTRRHRSPCENIAKFQTVADIDKPNVTVIENPAQQRAARRTMKAGVDRIFRQRDDLRRDPGARRR